MCGAYIAYQRKVPTSIKIILVYHGDNKIAKLHFDLARTQVKEILRG